MRSCRDEENHRRLGACHPPCERLRREAGASWGQFPDALCARRLRIRRAAQLPPAGGRVRDLTLETRIRKRSDPVHPEGHRGLSRSPKRQFHAGEGERSVVPSGCWSVAASPYAGGLPRPTFLCGGSRAAVFGPPHPTPPCTWSKLRPEPSESCSRLPTASRRLSLPTPLKVFT